MRRLTPITTLLTVLALLVVAPAGAAGKGKVAYSGTTAAGSRITFQVSPNAYAWTPETEIPITCTASEQGVVTETEMDSYAPYIGFPIGQRTEWIDDALSTPITYVFSAFRKGKVIKGSITETYSEIGPDNSGGVRAITCTGTTTFVARPAH
jgi:hypothetical protein